MKDHLLLTASYFASFVLGACIDIIRHSIDKIIPAAQANQVDDAITQRIIIAALLVVIVIGGVYWGSLWSRRKFGVKHRTGLQTLFLLTPIVVYVLEH